MLALQGYYDGVEIHSLEEFHAEKNQKLIITILDEFIEDTKQEKKVSARGALAKYANPALQEMEKAAWEKAMVEKHGNA